MLSNETLTGQEGSQLLQSMSAGFGTSSFNLSDGRWQGGKRDEVRYRSSSINAANTIPRTRGVGRDAGLTDTDNVHPNTLLVHIHLRSRTTVYRYLLRALDDMNSAS